MGYLEKFRLDGEVAVVTGGGRAIGLACVDALAEAGASVVVLERNEADAAEAIALRAKGYRIDVMLGDVTDAARMTVIADELAASGVRPRFWSTTQASAKTVSTRKTCPMPTGCA